MLHIETKEKKNLLSDSTGSILILEADTTSLSYFMEYLNRAYSQHFVIYGIRGNKCASLSALFNEWAAALQFPFYFGENLNAFADCMGDLIRANPTNHIIVVSKAGNLLLDDPDCLTEFFDVLSCVPDYWKQRYYPTQNHQFKLILQDSSDKAAELRSRLQQIAIDFDEISGDWLALI
jgi:hypothetical protein